MLNKRLLSLVPNIRGYLSKTVLFQWLCLLCSIGIIAAVCLFMQNCLRSGGSYFYPNVVKTACAVGICVYLKSLFTKIQIKTATTLSQNAKTILRDKIFTHLAAIGQNYSQSIPTAEAVQVAIEGVDQLETYFGAYLPQFFYAMLAPVTLFCCIAWIDLPSAAVLLVCVPLIPLSIIAVQKFAKKLLAKYWTAYTDLGDSFLENIQGLTTLKIYQADAQKQKEMEENAESFRKATMRVLMMQLNSIAVMDIVAYGGAAAGILTMMIRFSSGSISFLDGIFIILLSAEFFIPMRQLGSFFHVAMNGAAAAEKIFRILDTDIPAQGMETAAADCAISVQNLTFSYDATTTVLRNIQFQTDAQGLYAFVGKSGSGKSTIASLLTGKCKGFRGEMRIGGKSIAALSEKSLMQQITRIDHKSYLFQGTVRENLRMGKPDATEMELIEVLKAVNLLDFLRTQQGLDTPVAEEASNFSGGQRQRLALARALLHDTPIYIFDEATSNIDAESEAIIMEWILRLSQEKLVLLISHRLANVVSAKQIFVLEHGAIAAAGTHDALLQQENLYAALFQQQTVFEKFSEGGAAI